MPATNAVGGDAQSNEADDHNGQREDFCAMAGQGCQFGSLMVVFQLRIGLFAARLANNFFGPAIRAKVEGIRVAHAFQFAFCHAAAHPASAVQQQHLVFVLLFAMPLRIPLAQCRSST